MITHVCIFYHRLPELNLDLEEINYVLALIEPHPTNNQLVVYLRKHIVSMRTLH
jgi:hypothetical protein